MSIGVIIFIITIVISIVSAINDKSHEKRKQSPQQPPTSNPPKSFMDKVEQTLKEWEIEFDTQKSEDVFSPKETHSEPKPKPVKQKQHPKKVQKSRIPSERKRVDTQRQEQQVQKELLDMLRSDIDSLNDTFDRERQKHIHRIEQRARQIIDDKYLSPRTKRMKLKQLLSSSQQPVMTKGDLTFSNNEVVNGIIWAEVIDKRKQLN
ncbi:putative staphylococcal protein [Staphylococcus agnetis]|uniref:hypothetical protein n=1 Tax=Staphylococcus agnetis TaxID=985762 RepID=UPI000DFEC65C|nr:hypothetical protein [Staphylococcus agnetis]SUK13712.1 putative staphylococcal protein [Staphylococcus agnetis]